MNKLQFLFRDLLVANISIRYIFKSECSVHCSVCITIMYMYITWYFRMHCLSFVSLLVSSIKSFIINLKHRCCQKITFRKSECSVLEPMVINLFLEIHTDQRESTLIMMVHTYYFHVENMRYKNETKINKD